ncbi:V/A-type H+-transporting ATPase subunit C [Anaerobacterium chartisolvens]|uniref:V/A-type H+-transporting ATPase subunit C n=1 Tax=Anaerobacterium chartisolvens TaxID=1297424 RepID=A0A369B7I8_9FIRM|nr:V-type ATP synthase subunit C [Anaerobacterium chartisolvens]RCX17483.1 V/A-type H+-transporting ATPase subunit C [Anaerobacterium chartisolvens]
MKNTGGTEYTYAVSRIRAIEKKLLNESRLGRMIDAKTPEDVLKLLEEADYGYSPLENPSARDYERLLAEEHKKLYELLKEIAPKSDVVMPFLYMNDFHNIKVILKAEFSGQENYRMLLLEPSAILVGKLEAMIGDRRLGDMPAIMRKAVEECIDVFNRTSDPQMIDIILDKAGFMQMREMAGQIQNSFLSKLIVILIDLANIKIFMRVRKMKKSWNFLQRVLIDGGSIDSKVFIQGIEAPMDFFAEAVRFSAYGRLVEDGMEYFNSSGSLIRLEMLSDNFVMSYIKRAKYTAFGPEPLIGYLFAKESEMKNVRIIMVGKINNIPNDIIRERLRSVYA